MNTYIVSVELSFTKQFKIEANSLDEADILVDEMGDDELAQKCGINSLEYIIQGTFIMSDDGKESSY